MREIIQLLLEEIEYFKKLKAAIGEVHGHLHSLAVKAAKIFLITEHQNIKRWNLEEKYGKGIDILGIDNKGQVVVAAEVKTTFRSEKDYLGSQQRYSIITDVEKLLSTKAKYRYFFIIDERNRKAISNIVKSKGSNVIKLIDLSEQKSINESSCK